ncbi:hypothetical protein DRN86_00535 [Candidatus Geothermarchaeota archaeon]|nr:MAG: hypothetical protein DRN86_00535 [Candidatus Geothermarchaeota archaeon]
MRIEIISKGKNSIKFKIWNEDLTLGNLIREGLMVDERVIGAGVVEIHPLERSVTIHVALKSGDLKTIICDGARKAEELLRKIRGEVEKALKETS